MNFFKINTKVLLILCLFSGIMFLCTGCGDDEVIPEDSTSSIPIEEVETKEQTEKTTEEEVKEVLNSNSNVNYTVWVANTTINTSKDQRSYKVIWGDTLWLISTAWEVPYQEIARYNGIKNPDLIYVDQVIYNPRFK